LSAGLGILATAVVVVLVMRAVAAGHIARSWQRSCIRGATKCWRRTIARSRGWGRNSTNVLPQLRTASTIWERGSMERCRRTTRRQDPSSLVCSSARRLRDLDVTTAAELPLADPLERVPRVVARFCAPAVFRVSLSHESLRSVRL